MDSLVSDRTDNRNSASLLKSTKVHLFSGDNKTSLKIGMKKLPCEENLRHGNRRREERGEITGSVLDVKLVWGTRSRVDL